MTMIGRIRRQLRRFAVAVLTLRGSPEAVALGTAIGVFVAFTPTIGFQMLLAVILATAMRASRPAAVVFTWISNLATFVPVYGFTYWVGSLLWKGPPLQRVYNRLAAAAVEIFSVRVHEFVKAFLELLEIGWEIYLPMLIGGVVVGLVAGASCYWPVLWTVRHLRRWRLKQREAMRRSRLFSNASTTPKDDDETRALE